MSDFDLCSKFDATTSGSVAVKYFMCCFVKLDNRPFAFSFSSMSYAVTRLIFALLATDETRLGPSSTSER